MWLPIHCPLCLEVGAAPCASCRDLLRPAPDLEAPAGVDDVSSLFSYEGEGRRLVARLKFDNHRDAIGALAGELSALIGERPDLVTWIPTTGSRRRRRGFDQAELLGRALGRRLGVAARPTLRRTDATPQTGRSRSGRFETAFVARRACVGAILVVDDVRTTGASLEAAAAALREAGAGSVRAATLAATPQWAARNGGRNRPLRS